MKDLHQYVECTDIDCGCPGEHCGVCGQPSGSDDGRVIGCRWDLAAEALTS